MNNNFAEEIMSKAVWTVGTLINVSRWSGILHVSFYGIPLSVYVSATPLAASCTIYAFQTQTLSDYQLALHPNPATAASVVFPQPNYSNPENDQYFLKRKPMGK